MLKASPIVIHTMLNEEEIQDRALAYFRVIMENYEQVFWDGMDLSRQEFDDMIGIFRDNGETGSGQIISTPEWPIP